MSIEEKYLEAEPYSIHYSSDTVNKVISNKVSNFGSHYIDNESVDKKMDNLMEFIFGSELTREVE